MSHCYTVFKDNVHGGEVVDQVQLSNINHYNFCMAVGLTREMQCVDTGATETWCWHTTIHDKQPLTLSAEETIDYIDKYIEASTVRDSSHDILEAFASRLETMLSEGKAVTVYF